MPTRFVFNKGYLSAQADFARPPLELLSQPGTQRLAEELLARLGPPHGLRIGQMKINNSDGDLGRAHLSCSLFEFNAALRIGLERLELESYYVERIGREALLRVMPDAASAMIALTGKNPFSTWTVDLGLHGLLPDTTPKDFTGRFFASAPQAPGALMGSGCTFYYGQSEEQLLSIITIDRSALVEGGLFFRKRTTWAASILSIDALPERAGSEVDKALAGLGLGLVGNDPV
jgi:hypothetical protein